MIDQPLGAPVAISQLETPSISVVNAAEIKAILQKHGCTLNEKAYSVLITFPPGTTRQPLQGLAISERYKIRLPDGYLIYETLDCMRNISFLELTREVQR
jgi:hypothetical protein